MATHRLHLHPEPFERVRSGKQVIESRLFDEKRRTYAVGDKLIFINREAKHETIESTIIHLHKEASFQDLFLNKMTEGKFSTNSVEELLEGVELYYSKEDQEKYGVVGIEFRVDAK